MVSPQIAKTLTALGAGRDVHQLFTTLDRTQKRQWKPTLNAPNRNEGGRFGILHLTRVGNSNQLLQYFTS